MPRMRLRPSGLLVQHAASFKWAASCFSSGPSSLRWSPASKQHVLISADTPSAFVGRTSSPAPLLSSFPPAQAQREENSFKWAVHPLKPRVRGIVEKSDRGTRMVMSTAAGDLSSEMEVDAFRRLFPLRFYERHLAEAIRPDARRLGNARETTVVLGTVASAHGSALAKIGSTTMLAAVKLEVMTPSAESLDEGCIAIDFHMPPICSPIVRPGRPAEAAPPISKQLSDTLLSSGMIDLKELSLVSGKAAWMAYLDIYCLDADGSLFDVALLSTVAAFSHLQIPVVSLNDDGKIVLMSEEDGEKLENEPVNKEKRKLKLRSIPFSLTCILHKNHILADPTAEEEAIMETIVTIALDSSSRLVSFYKPGGPVLAYTSGVQECVALTKQRVVELQGILKEAISDMEID